MSSRLLLSAALALLTAGPALAGGFAQPIVTPPPAPPVVVTPPVVASADWSGPYVGAQLGFGRFSTDLSAETPDGDEEIEFLEGNGALYGVHAGYMFDFGRLVAGVEADWDLTSIGLDLSDEAGEGAPFDSVGEIGSVARGKLRLGYDAGRVLPYLTAGVARATFDYDVEEAEAVLEDSGNGTVFGAGVSFMASDRLMIGVEALRHNFDEVPELTGAAVGGGELDTVVDTVTLRGSFRF